VDIMTLLILARGVDYYVGVSVFSKVAEPSLSLSLPRSEASAMSTRIQNKSR